MGDRSIKSFGSLSTGLSKRVAALLLDRWLVPPTEIMQLLPNRLKDRIECRLLLRNRDKDINCPEQTLLRDRLPLAS